MTLIDWFVVAGIGVVVPLALGESVFRWGLLASAAACSFFLDEGVVAALVVAPVPAAAVVAGARHARRHGPLLFWERLDAIVLLAYVWVAVAGGGLVVSRGGWSPLGQHEPIIELTAVHYLYAGCAALVLAGWTQRLFPGVLTAVAPPIVAIGFLTEHPFPQVGGAVVMALAVFVTATLQLAEAARAERPTGERVLLVVSGLSVWAPMVLAVAWAAGQHWDIPILSIPDMARTHGALNAIGFVFCGLVARRRERRDREFAARLEQATGAAFTYDHVGLTLSDACSDRATKVLGRGRDVFDEAVRRLKTWNPQRRLGAQVLPAGVEPRPGATVLVDLRLGPIAIAVPNRVVDVIDEARRWGFAYGTLRGHHESGEESFVVTHHPDDTVTASIAVAARPASAPARLAGPLVRRVQRHAIRRYLEALA